jgi:hypothetical protein
VPRASTTVRVYNRVVYSNARVPVPGIDAVPLDRDTGQPLHPQFAPRPAMPPRTGVGWEDTNGITYRVVQQMEPAVWASYETVARWYDLQDLAEMKHLVAQGAIDAAILVRSLTRRYRVVSDRYVKRCLDEYRNPPDLPRAPPRVRVTARPKRAAR